MLESGQALSAGLTLIRRLGAGGGGEVWLAEDRQRDPFRRRRIAIKILSDALASDENAIRALERECERVRSLDHPNILRVDGVHRFGRCAWLAMEYAPRGDLTQLRGRGAVEVLRAAHPIAAALTYAHEAGVVHRDVKPANVLLSEDGRPLLADFGMALDVAAFPATDAGRGSLYTMSPQQLAGAPAHASDDVYGFGAMLYELLSGYPPFYPNATLERICAEAPAPLPAATPRRAAELIERMLAKAREARPDMRTVERELRDAFAEASATSNMSNASNADSRSQVRIEPPSVRPPGVHGEPLKGEWRRDVDVGRETRGRPGARRVVGGVLVASAIAGLATVFVVLPRVVEQGETARYVPAASTLQPEAEAAAKEKEEIDFAALARAKQDADERRGPIEERLKKLTERAADRWGGAEYAAAVDHLAAGDAAYAEREYATAVEHFSAMEPLVKQLEERAAGVLKEQLAAGADAIATGRSGDAQAAFELAAKIEPGNAVAAQGLKRAGVLDEVLRLVANGERLEKDGHASAAIADFRKALALDAQTTRAAEGVARIEAKLAGDAFASAMARGYGALASADYGTARAAFEQARKLRPDSPEIGQALRQIEQEQRTGVISAKLAKAQEHERAERWEEALKEHRAVLELDSTVAAASEGQARTAPRAALNEQLELYITQPERLFSQPVRAAARDTLARASAIANPGPLLKKQLATVSDYIARADAPVAIAFESDNVTQVTIYRVGELGAFAQRSLELAPGSYTVVGTRPGYRDVRRQINVAPGAALEPIVIRCEDRI